MFYLINISEFAMSQTRLNFTITIQINIVTLTLSGNKVCDYGI